MFHEEDVRQGKGIMLEEQFELSASGRHGRSRVEAVAVWDSLRPEELSEGELSHISEAAVTDRVTMPEEVMPEKDASRRGTLLKIIE